ncbi:1-acyl-sn-glycerol-3-phosphate acyltransferase, partial [Rhizobium ruizarguesonis]
MPRDSFLIALRSVLFNTIFYANLLIRMIVLSPYYFVVPRKIAYAIPKNGARSNHWLMRVIVGTTFEIEGRENLPDG